MLLLITARLITRMCGLTTFALRSALYLCCQDTVLDASIC